MSTPAENTRQRRRLSSGKSQISFRSDLSTENVLENNNSWEEVVDQTGNLRQRKCQKKALIANVEKQRSNELVKQWLQSSELPFTGDKRLYQSAIDQKNFFEVLKPKKGESNVTSGQSETDSEVSFITPPQCTISGIKENCVSLTPQPVRMSATTGRITRNKGRTMELKKKLLHVSDDEHVSNEHYKAWAEGAGQHDYSSEKIWSEETSREGSETSELKRAQHDDGSSQNDSDESQSVDDHIGNGHGRDKTVIENTEENPSAEDVDLIEQYKKRLQDEDQTVFYDMFEVLLTKLSVMETSIKRIRSEQDSLTLKVHDIESTLTQQDVTNTAVNNEIDEVSAMNLKLVEASIKCENSISI